MNWMEKARDRIKDGEIISDMLVSGICRPLSMIVSYIYIPVVLGYLGVEKYGVWATILTILSWVSYFDIGIGNGLRNRLTECFSKDRRDECRKLVSSAYAFIAVIMAVFVILFCAVASRLDWNKILGIRSIDENLEFIVCISVIFVAVNFVLSVCKNILYSLQRAADVSIMELGTQTLNLIGVWILRYFVSESLLWLAVIYGMSMLAVNIGFSIFIFIRHRFLRPGWKDIDIQTGKDITALGMQFFVIQISALILFTTDSLIISNLYSAADVTPYSTVNKLFTAISSMHVALLAPIWSAATKAKTNGEYQYLKKMVEKLNLLIIPFVCMIFVLMACFKPLSRIWLGQELDYSRGIILFGGIYCFLTMWCSTYSSLANGLELMKLAMGTAVIQAVVNIPVSLYLAREAGMGVSGILAGTDFAMAIAAVTLPAGVCRHIKRQVRGSWPAGHGEA